MKKAETLKLWILLWQAPGVGAKTYQKLLDKFDSPQDVFAATAEMLKQAGISPKVVSSIQNQKNANSANADIEWLNSSDRHFIITIDCAEYPALLKQINNPPPLLYIHGNPSLLNDPQLAVVGSRSPTQSGLSNAYEFSKFLANSGLCITSGLALGVDGAAHKGALDANAPTIAVIATGADRIYPARHRDLAHRIVEQGAIVSEFSIGTQAKSENFPRRNRLISGMSHGTLVVEAAKRSGSLITAQLASEQNREVLAIPGSIHNPLARGCHQLIRQGAKLVETAEDILEEMANVIDVDSIQNDLDITSSNIISPESTIQEESKIDTDSEYNELLDQMGYDPISIDELVLRTSQSPESIAAMLLMLELKSKVSSNGGGTYTRIS